MRVKSNRIIGLLFSVLLVFQSSLIAQSSNQEKARATEEVRLRTDLVLLDVEVMNKRTGAHIVDLNKSDFLVYENDVRQEIVHFGREDFPHSRRPLSIVLLVSPIDVSTVNSIELIHRAAQSALEELGPEDEVALMIFGKGARLLQGLTRDRRMLLEKLARATEFQNLEELARSAEYQDILGLPHVDEAIYQAAAYLGRAGDPLSRRVIVAVMSANWINFRGLKGHSTKEALIAAYRSNALVYGVLLKTPEPGWYQGAKVWWKVNPVFLLFRGGTMKTYADATGGEVLVIQQGELATFLPGLFRQIQAQYTLGYLPSNSKRDGKVRQIKVKMTREVEKRYGELIIRTRKGYIAAPEQNVRKK